VKGSKKLSKNSKKYMILDRSKVLLISSELNWVKIIYFLLVMHESNYGLENKQKKEIPVFGSS
jgi:hypothetical protein